MSRAVACYHACVGMCTLVSSNSGNVDSFSSSCENVLTPQLAIEEENMSHQF